MSTTQTPSRSREGAPPTPFETARAAATAGILAVVVAFVAGAVLAGVLIALGLTTTPLGSLSQWLAGTGLLGGWRQTVTSSVAGGLEWSTWVAGAPMAVTLAVLLTVSMAARRRGGSPLIGTCTAAVGAAAAAVVLVLLSGAGSETANAAGTVAVQENLTAIWTGATRPGTVVGAALLVGGVWWINTAGLDWWQQGRPVAYGLLIIPGLVITVAVAAGVVYLTSSPAVGLATVMLFPLLGTTAVLAAAGAPAHVGVTRVTPEPFDVWTWSSGLLVGVGGLVLAVLVATVVGLVLRRRRHAGGWAAGITVPAAVAGFVCWATGASIVVPEALGGPTVVSVNPLAAMVVGAVMSCVCLAVRGPAPAGRPSYVSRSDAASA